MRHTIAVLGLGSIGLRHARNLAALCVPVVGYDPDSSQCDLARSAGIAIAESRSEALMRARGAVVASPSQFHLDDLAAAVAAHCHVFVEKPLAHKTAGIREVLAQARDGGLIVFAGLMLRWHPAVTWAADLLHAGTLGAPLWGRAICASYLPSWRPGQDHRAGYAADPSTGGVLFDVIHEFDLLQNLLGPYQVRACVAQSTGRIGIRSDDLADALLVHDSGAQSSIHVDYLTSTPVRITEIGAERGRLALDLAARRATVWRMGEASETVGFEGGFDDDYRAEMADFVACMAGEMMPRCDGEEALAVLEQVVEARRLAALPAA